MFTVTNTDPTTDIDHLVKFASKEQKDEFISREVIFCNQEMKYVRDAKIKAERDKFKKQLFNKRIKFLIKENFVKLPGNVWEKLENDADPEDDDDYYGT